MGMAHNMGLWEYHWDVMGMQCHRGFDKAGGPQGCFYSLLKGDMVLSISRGSQESWITLPLLLRDARGPRHALG